MSLIRLKDFLRSPPNYAVTARLRRGLLGLLLAVHLAGAPPTTAATEAPLIPGVTATAFDHDPLRGVLLLPARTPLGLVLVLHDATGPDRRVAPYVDQLLGAGFAVLDILEHDDDVATTSAAAHGLARRIGGQGRTAVVAFGAGVAMAAELRDLAAYVLLYPGCAALPPGLADGAGPLMIVHGGMDAANATDTCAAAVGGLAAAGRSVRHLVYEGAGYAWDYPPHGLEYRFMLPRPDGRGRVPAVPWAELARMSASQVAGFVAIALAP